MKYSTFTFIALFSAVIFYACNQTSNPVEKKVSTETPNDSSENSCDNESEAIMDPNNAKPMALMMRTMVKNAQSMKNQVESGAKLDSLKYPFIRFYLVEPTDPNVLEPAFYENARLFQEAYQNLFEHPQEQSKYYNLMVGKCINCHENYCSGPIKRIKKLLIKI
jgi:hypothetical protein